MTDGARALFRVAGVLAVVVAAAVGIGLYEIFKIRDYMVPIGVADVEGAWTAEEGGDARLVVRGDGTAELTSAAQADVCGWPAGRDTRVIRAAWTFGDIDDPRLIHLELKYPDPDTAYPCYFDLYVDPDGQAGVIGDGRGPYSAYVRSDTAD
ncbi:hypothetical protein ACI2LO_11460 [Streptomyces sp. NPDC033754]|uniref:hypothetical protein n=1 Tax=unclassified Streptomyces TaxID=2593676 RepID=UPI003402CCE8